MAEKEIVAGIDIGGTNTVIGLVDKIGKVISETAISTREYDTFEKYIDFIVGKIKMLCNTGGYNLRGVGIGAPNGNVFRGTIEYAANLEWKGILPIADLLFRKLNVPVKVANDANAAALGEKLFGKGKHTDNFIVITLGTGLGSGIVAEGNLLYGHSGFAGELGHVPVKENGRQCGCGKKGCLETYVSATGIVRTVKESLLNSKKSSLLRNENVENINSKMIFEYAQKGDALALEAFDYTAEIFGKALADFTAVLSPEIIFLFGGLANAGDLLLKPTEKYMNDNLLSVYKNTVKIELSGLKNGEAAILGSAALAWSEID